MGDTTFTMLTTNMQICPECAADTEVACPRNCDGTCLNCGKSLCARHMLLHWKNDECVSFEWRGFLRKK